MAKLVKPYPQIKRSFFVSVILYVRLFLGLYTNLSTSRTINNFLKLYCLSATILLSYFNSQVLIIYFEKENYLFFPLTFTLFYTILTSILSLFSDGENIKHFLKSIDSIEINNLMKHRKNESTISFFIFLGIILKNIIRYVYFHINYRHINNFSFIISSVSWVEHSLTHMTKIIIFECLWCKLTSLKKEIKEHCLESTSDSNDDTKIKIKKLQELMLVYGKILYHKKYAGNITKFLILTNMASYFIYIYCFVVNVFKPGAVQIDLFYIFDLIINMAIPLVPALFVELGNVEVSAIQSHIEGRLIHVTSPREKNKIIDILKYLELHPYRYSVWRTFYVDVSLPLYLVGACTSFIIVVIQFLQM